MYLTITPTEVYGTIKAPSSKSMLQRAIAAACLANGTSTLQNPSWCNDSRAAIELIKLLGATVSEHAEFVSITGNFTCPENALHCGESGLATRMFSPIAALHARSVTIGGEGSLLKRPMDNIVQALSAFGVETRSHNGFLPITIHGPLRGGTATIDCSLSSQVLTGLLMALPLATCDSVVKVTNLASKPYIDMTLQLLSDFGIEVENADYQEFRIKANQKYKAINYAVEGDWSSAAFFLVAGAIAGNIKIENLSTNSKQADAAIIKVLKTCGTNISVKDNSIRVQRSDLLPFDFDANDCPDLFPPLVALAANCKAPSKIWGVNRLLHKESNRVETLQTEFAKMGIKILIDNDLMIVEPVKIKSAKVHSHNDHRIAMACAIAALRAEDEVDIENTECVSKSYPEFFLHLKKVSGKRVCAV